MTEPTSTFAQHANTSTWHLLTDRIVHCGSKGPFINQTPDFAEDEYGNTCKRCFYKLDTWWRPDTITVCSECGKELNSQWGHRHFRID